MSPDTSAQDAPVASQEAVRGVLGGEAVVEIAFANLMERWIPRPQMTRHEWRALFTEVEAVIRASERERYAGLRPLLDAIESAFSRFGEGSMGGSEMSRTERFAVLSEEVGEVAAEVVKEQRNRSREPGKHGPFDVEALIAELTQVAACAVMWAGQERAALAALEEAESA